MRIRWFGEPWPSEEERAPICDDDAYRVDVPVGQTCVGCEREIEASDQGIVMASSPELPLTWTIWKWGDPVAVCVCGYHRECFLLSVLGPDVLEMVKRQ